MAESPKTGNDEFGEAVRVARERLGMSRRDLAETTGLSYPYISQIETGYRMPSTQAMRSLADALGLRPDRLFDAIPSSTPRDTGPPRPAAPASAMPPAGPPMPRSLRGSLRGAAGTGGGSAPRAAAAMAPAPERPDPLPAAARPAAGGALPPPEGAGGPPPSADIVAAAAFDQATGDAAFDDAATGAPFDSVTGGINHASTDDSAAGEAAYDLTARTAVGSAAGATMGDSTAAGPAAGAAARMIVDDLTGRAGYESATGSSGAGKWIANRGFRAGVNRVAAAPAAPSHDRVVNEAAALLIALPTDDRLSALTEVQTQVVRSVVDDEVRRDRNR